MTILGVLQQSLFTQEWDFLKGLENKMHFCLSCDTEQKYLRQ